MNNSIFPILAFDDKKKVSVDNGAGFFINIGGYFISAGHVFKTKSRTYFAKIDNHSYPIELVYDEYVKQEQQEVPTYKDLYIGKINFDSAHIEPLTFSIETIKNPDCFACGYSSKNQTHNQNIKTQDEVLWSDDCEIEKKLNYHKLPIKYCGEKINRAFNGNIKWFDNGFRVDLNDMYAGGLSGGPVIADDLVRGVLITTDNCISSEYITSLLREHNINFKINE